jgi:hypothetical protein
VNITDVLTDDLRRAPWKGSPDPLAGHCYVVAEALYHRALDLGYEAKPYFIRHEGAPHWFVRVNHPDLGWYTFDPTQSQFATPVPHEQAKGKGFLTKEPSRRARVVMERMGWRN